MLKREMEKTKVLFIFQEISPYLPDSTLSLIGRHLPQGIQEKGKEIRTFMPKYGCINERRYQLHEVIRLSGMNLIIGGNDHPLIIKVASIQSARMQIYFIDNEDYFSRKYTLTDEENKDFDDNDERMIFYNRGVLETILKLNWVPDVIHCHGWFTGMLPMYIKKSFSDNPVFNQAKVVYSIYDDDFKQPFKGNFKTKAMHDGLSKKDFDVMNEPTYTNLMKLAVKYSDGVVLAGQKKNNELNEYIASAGLPTLVHLENDYSDSYSEFYDQLV
jgi:starch synthase